MSPAVPAPPRIDPDLVSLGVKELRALVKREDLQCRTDVGGFHKRTLDHFREATTNARRGIAAPDPATVAYEPLQGDADTARAEAAAQRSVFPDAAASESDVEGAADDGDLSTRDSGSHMGQAASAEESEPEPPPRRHAHQLDLEEEVRNLRLQLEALERQGREAELDLRLRLIEAEVLAATLEEQVQCARIFSGELQEQVRALQEQVRQLQEQVRQLQQQQQQQQQLQPQPQQPPPPEPAPELPDQFLHVGLDDGLRLRAQ